MCLEKTHGFYKIAKKDLYTVKYLESDLKSPFEKFQYELNKLYSIKTGFGWGVFDTQIHNGFHSINGLYTLIFYKIVVCKIPKGSKYYLGTNGDVVSDSIVIVEVINIPDIYYSENRIIYALNYILKKFPKNNLIQLDKFNININLI